MRLITIPSDFVEGETKVVPICIRAEDSLGNRIAEGWINGVIRVADGLRSLSRRILQDEWRVSELADETVQDLWDEHGENVGAKPHSRVYAHAQWKALDKRAGGIRARKGLEVELVDHIYRTLRDPGNFAAEYERRDLLHRLSARLNDLELNDVQKMVDLALHDADFDIAHHFGKSRNTLSKRFWRGIRRASDFL
jgi:hypothetical protein